jgi:FAD/FMN-containing dehydrogenase
MNLENYESFGRYPRHLASDVIKLQWRKELPDLDNMDHSILPYGCGKSYGDVCLNKGGILVDTRGMNKLICFDPDNDIIKCESGVTLAALLDFLVPRGFFLSVTPGTKHITVGGAIANDVHGKNHHRKGTFGTQVISFELVRSNGDVLHCSREENPEMFDATIGGLGLTGLITWAEFRVTKVPSPYIKMDSIKFDNLEEFFEINSEADNRFDYTVSWIDCTATGSRIGRGIYTGGNFTEVDRKKSDLKESGNPPNFPLEYPFINNATVNLFNKLYFNKQINKSETSITHYNPFFYPLDAVDGWNKAYGKNGFLQYQFLVPFGREYDTVHKLLRKVSESGLSSFLTVMKTFGDVPSPGMLSFPKPGVNLAIDFRYNGRKTLETLNLLDEIVRNAGGSIYPAKDAHMSGEDFKRFYPMWKEFEKYKDLKFSSSFWRRVTQ